MASTFKIFVDKMGGNNPDTYIGTFGELFYNPAEPTLRISDGVTPGGNVIPLEVTHITYAELLAKVNAGTLVSHSYYQITDYQTIYDQPDYSAIGIPKTTVATLTGSVESLIVMALSNNNISNQAWSTTHPNDYIEYDISFVETEYMHQPAKGRIILRVTDKYNQTPYDSRAVLFKRYESAPGSGKFVIVADNGGASVSNIPTFGLDCENIKIDKHASSLIHIDDSIFLVSNNIFGNSCEAITTGPHFFNNTFGTFCYANEFGHGVNDNIIGDVCNNNHISNDFVNNVIGNGFCNNVISNGFASNIIGDDFNSNHIIGTSTGTGFDSNTIGNSFKFNFISSNFSNPDITIGANFMRNHIADSFYNNVAIGTDFKDNVIEATFSDNTVGVGFKFNDIHCEIIGKNLTIDSNAALSICYNTVNTNFIMAGTGTTPTPSQVYIGYFNSDAGPTFGWKYTAV